MNGEIALISAHKQVLEKLKNDEAPKTQYKRASLLNRRLQNKPEEPTSVGKVPLSNPSRLSPLTMPKAPPSTPAQSRGNFSTPDRSMGPPPPSPFTDTPRPQNKPRNMFASFMKAAKPETEKPVCTPNQNSSNESASPQSNYLPMQRQKMLFVEAENVAENFIRPIFEKYGPLLRLTSVSDKK